MRKLSWTVSFILISSNLLGCGLAPVAGEPSMKVPPSERQHPCQPTWAETSSTLLSEVQSSFRTQIEMSLRAAFAREGKPFSGVTLDIAIKPKALPKDAARDEAATAMSWFDFQVSEIVVTSNSDSKVFVPDISFVPLGANSGSSSRQSIFGMSVTFAKPRNSSLGELTGYDCVSQLNFPSNYGADVQILNKDTRALVALVKGQPPQYSQKITKFEVP
jgi:hypothetical protein